MQLRKLCVLSEHVDKVIKHIGDTPITVRAYKYHTEVRLSKLLFDIVSNS